MTPEENDNQMKQKISTGIAGIACGLLMTTVVVFLLRFTQYTSNGLQLLWMTLLLLGICYAVDAFGKRGLNLWILETGMVGLSWILSILYAQVSAMNAETFQQLVFPIVVLHGLTLGLNSLRLWIWKRRGWL